jgi:ArsR family transcriptional regulator, arsenate/arsenite/antimonite-responsive transcriptional repressor / arsenate reductase (thioredoxin)
MAEPSHHLERRAAVHAALGEPIRLAIVDELLGSDRSPSELAERFDLPSNLLAHHLAVLERVGVVERTVSSGDRRRRYVRVLPELVMAVPSPPVRRAPGTALFVCTHNSARSQLAASIWRHHAGSPALSAGTHPADRVHPGAVLAGRRRGLDLSDSVPRRLGPDDIRNADLVVTVCDRAHEEVDLPSDALHWSVPDPVGASDPHAFDRAADTLARRIRAVVGASNVADEPPGTPATVTSTTP